MAKKKQQQAKPNILIVSDLHLPFCNVEAVKRVISYAKDFKPDYIVQLGDLYDNYSFSKYRKSLEYISPAEEVARARELAEYMWAEFKKVAPKAKCLQLQGNHELRLPKRVLEKLPEFELLVKKSIDELFIFPGVDSIFDPREPVEVGGILFHHGWMTGAGKHLHYFNQSCVVGHSHQGGIHFENSHGKILFELNAGHLADVNSLPLSYTPIKRSKSTLGFAIVENGIPVFVPLE